MFVGFEFCVLVMCGLCRFFTYENVLDVRRKNVLDVRRKNGFFVCFGSEGYFFVEGISWMAPSHA